VIRSAWLIMIGLLSAGLLRAQATVVKPEEPLDSARAVLRDAVLVFRDSLGTIDAAAARLQRDFRQTSQESLLSRARVMHEACARSVRAAPSLKKTLLAAQITEPLRIRRRRQLVNAIDQLRGVLNRCEVDFAAMSQPGQGETVRGYSNTRSEVVQGAIRKYEDALRVFLSAFKIYVAPAGSAPRTLSG
jgi:hypothetical protein